MIIIVSRRRNRSFIRSWAASWIIPAALVAIVLFAIWPLLAFRHHWTTVAQVPCWQNPELPACANVPWNDVIATAPQAVHQSAVTALGMGLFWGWALFWFVLVMTGSVIGRRQKARRV